MKPGLQHFIKGFVKDFDVSEDLLARTFQKIYVKIDTFNPEFSITTWSYSIARRECLRWIKRERNRKVSLSYINENGGEAVAGENGITSISISSSLIYEEDFKAEDKEDSIWKDDNIEIIKYDMTVKAINALKPMHREILIDNLFKGMKYKDIAFKIEPDLSDLNSKMENGELSETEEEEFHKYYKTILQRVKNRVRRGKMIVENKVNNDISHMNLN